MNYKAWNKKFECMVRTTELCYVTNEGVFMLRPDMKENLYELLPIERFEIIRPTGLTDRNGVEIYEGDILKADDETLSKIVYHEASFKCVFRYNASLVHNILDKNFIDDLNVEVIGNIYEHQHLLEGVK